MMGRGKGGRGKGGSGRRVAWKALQIVLTVAVTGFILNRVGLGVEELAALGADAWRPRAAGTFLLSCALLLAGYVASAAIWARMVADLGGPRLPLRAAAEVYFVANLGRYVPGKVWQIAGLAVLGLRRGVPAAVSTAAAVLGQVVALGGAALVGAAALIGGSAPGAGDGGPGGWTLLFLAVLAFMLAVALVPALQRRATGLWFRIARREEIEVRPSAATTLRWLVLYTLNWVIYAAAFFVLVRSFELPGGAIALGSAFAAAYVLGYAALFAPAGIGVREGFLVVFLSPVVGVAPAGAMAIVARLWTTAVELIPAAALWALEVARPAASGPGGPPPDRFGERSQAGAAEGTDGPDRAEKEAAEDASRAILPPGAP